jgi:ribonuclease P protein component
MASIARRITAWREGEIRRTIRRSRRCIRSTYVDVSVILSRDIARILIIIPKKVGTAVVRNRTRRRIRSLFFEKQLFSAGTSWIVYVKPPTASCTFSELRELFMEWARDVSHCAASLQSSSSGHFLEHSDPVDLPSRAPPTRKQH